MTAELRLRRRCGGPRVATAQLAAQTCERSLEE